MAPLLVAHAEHVLSTGDPYRARRLAEKGLVVAVGALLERPRAVWMRLRIEADIASLGALGRAHVEASLVDEALALATSPLPSRVAYGALCAAELARVAGQSTRQLWSDAADRLVTIESRHRVAYARMREAEAVLIGGGAGGDEAGPPLRDAYRIAHEIGASPLAADIEVLAQRGRVSLMPAVAEGPSQLTGSRVAGYALTVRELEVLRYLAAGMTNREIGEALFISPKTASVHVSNILRKLGVANRMDAAAIAHRILPRAGRETVASGRSR
jgi:DNA-binding CsgD family transcriptional regulator